MAEQNRKAAPQSAELEPLDLELVDATFQVKGGANRDEAACIVSRTGHVKFNVGGSEAMDDVALLNNLKPGQYGVTYAVDLKRRLVGVNAVDLETPNAMQVRRNAQMQNSIHLGAVFQKYPRLRPVTRSTCLVGIRKDSNGVDCLIIALQMPQARQTRTRKSSAGTAPSTAR